MSPDVRRSVIRNSIDFSIFRFDYLTLHFGIFHDFFMIDLLFFLFVFFMIFFIYNVLKFIVLINYTSSHMIIIMMGCFLISVMMW